MKTTITLLAVLLTLVAVGSLRADEDAQKGTRWTLNMEHGPLKIVAVRSAAGLSKSYHYLTIKVTNPTSLPRDWFPMVTAITDTKRVYTAMGYEEALDEIRAAEGNDDLISIGTTKGKIQPGETLDTAAIFGPLDPLYDRVKIQLLGLADPIGIYKLKRYDITIEEPNVVYKQATGDGKFEVVNQGITILDVAYVERNEAVMAAMHKAAGEGELPEPASQYWEVSERRVFEMIYTRPGDEFRPDDDLISFEREHWRVVGDVKLLRQIEM